MYISSLQFTVTLIEKLGLSRLFGNPWSVGSAPPNSFTHFSHMAPAGAAWFSQNPTPLTSVDQHWTLSGTV